MAKLALKQRLHNAVLGWFSPSGSGDYMPVSPINSLTGETLTTDSVLRLAAVWACVRLIAETIASLPLGIYQTSGQGKRYAPEHPLHMILHDTPNPDCTASVMWESFVAAMLLPGNGFCEKLVFSGRIVGLRFLAPARLSITRGLDGKREYRYTYDDGIQRIIPPDRIWRVPGFTLDGNWGVSSIYYGCNVFGGAQAADNSAASVYKSGLQKTTAFQYPEKLRSDQREDARKYILDQSGIMNAGRPIILEGGMTVQDIGINPSDAQLLESRRYSREDICSWFRVPPWMVGYGEKSTAWGTGMEQQMIAFLQFVLAPWLRRIEQYINKDLLTPDDRARGFYAKFSVEGLLRADSKSRADFYDKMIKAAVMTPDQARELEEWEAMGGNAGKLIVNSATTLLDKLGEQNEPQFAGATRAAPGQAADGQNGDSGIDPQSI